MEKKQIENIIHLISPVVEGLGCEFVGCEIQPRGRRSLVRVYIDRPQGATIDDCERISRQLSAVFDVEDPIQGGYDLEVSTPGLNRPLFTLAQYRQFVGKKIRIKLHIPYDGRRNFTGTLTAVNGENIIITGENEENWHLSFVNIEKGSLIAE